ncbi:hypothetical protein [Sinorhizobium americanum]|uniref:Uncharacterized protein n=1 Tax=Sinorhizobium americanum TaxID=194963 RepID=A0A4R2B7T5_9HYPH|nr:hypothetical protein [Sinorhizobium americanum]TCN22768.1 hypothetical protein EV184_12313 [Sinorhizobium americanum]
MGRENFASAGAVAAGVIVLFIIGVSRPHLLVEDNLVESAGALIFAVACVLALDTAARKRVLLSSKERIMLVGTSGLCLVLFLSEISFGARLFGLPMPILPGGGEFDGGHDVVILTFRLLRQAETGYLLLMIGALLIVAGVLLCLYWSKLQAMFDQILSRAFEFRLAMAVSLLASAVTLDLLDSYKASILEEVAEFVASGVLVFAILALPRKMGATTVDTRWERSRSFSQRGPF